ncbi:hypothetical protein FB451DRAFT_1362873 [Mycena latifolia]|nr:hypothetical protein FB451DRAFT_1362873 [Mycena latifolia]
MHSLPQRKHFLWAAPAKLSVISPVLFFFLVMHLWRSIPVWPSTSSMRGCRRLVGGEAPYSHCLGILLSIRSSVFQMRAMNRAITVWCLPMYDTLEDTINPGFGLPSAMNTTTTRPKVSRRPTLLLTSLLRLQPHPFVVRAPAGAFPVEQENIDALHIVYLGKLRMEQGVTGCPSPGASVSKERVVSSVPDVEMPHAPAVTERRRANRGSARE